MCVCLCVCVCRCDLEYLRLKRGKEAQNINCKTIE